MPFNLNPTFSPRYWQSDQVNACISILWGKGNPVGDTFVPSDNAVICLNTAGGKTYEAAMLCHRFLNAHPNKSILIAVHRDKLVEGMRKSIHAAILNIQTSIIDASNKKTRPATIYIAMVKTVNNRIAKAHKIKDTHDLDSDFYKIIDNVGLVIIDEAHRGEHRKFEKIIKSRHKIKTIGFTATPKSATKKDPLINHYRDTKGNGCIVKYFKNGEWITGPSTQELIAWNREHPKEGLVDEVYITQEDTLTDNDKKGLIHNGKVDDVAQGKMLKKPKFIDHVVSQYRALQIILDDAPTKKGIIFHASIEHSKTVCSRFEHENIPSMHIDGTTPYDERLKIFEWFENTHDAVLHNVGIATTGIDIPAIMFVILNKYTISVTEFLQCFGRGGRAYVLGDWVKKFFISVDMHNSYKIHGHWHENRNWEHIFLYPDKPGNGVAPMKDCPQCKGIVSASRRICDQMDYDESTGLYFPCNFVFPVNVIEEPSFIKFKVSNSLPPDKIKEWQTYLEQNQGMDIYRSLNEMFKSVVNKYYAEFKEMDENICAELIELGMQHAKVWKSVNGKKGGDWLVSRCNRVVKERIKELFGIEFHVLKVE